MTPPRRWILTALAALLPLMPAGAGQLTWTPGGAVPSLVVNLGDGVVKKTLDLPSGAAFLDLTLNPFLVDAPWLTLVWKTDGVLWLRQGKKIPGAGTTLRMALPPGKLIALEVTTRAGTPTASIKLRRK